MPALEDIQKEDSKQTKESLLPGHVDKKSYNKLGKDLSKEETEEIWAKNKYKLSDAKRNKIQKDILNKQNIKEQKQTVLVQKRVSTAIDQEKRLSKNINSGDSPSKIYQKKQTNLKNQTKKLIKSIFKEQQDLPLAIIKISEGHEKELGEKSEFFLNGKKYIITGSSLTKKGELLLKAQENTNEQNKVQYTQDELQRLFETHKLLFPISKEELTKERKKSTKKHVLIKKTNSKDSQNIIKAEDTNIILPTSMADIYFAGYDSDGVPIYTEQNKNKSLPPAQADQHTEPQVEEKAETQEEIIWTEEDEKLLETKTQELIDWQKKIEKTKKELANLEKQLKK
jgi:hypothetical protein